jgi:hypothetical protein
MNFQDQDAVRRNLMQLYAYQMMLQNIQGPVYQQQAINSLNGLQSFLQPNINQLQRPPGFPLGFEIGNNSSKDIQGLINSPMSYSSEIPKNFVDSMCASSVKSIHLGNNKVIFQ